MSEGVESVDAWAEVARVRLDRSGLLGDLKSPRDAARTLVGVQAQDLSAAGLAISARCPAVTRAELVDQLYQRRSVVRIWGQRNTLHIYASEDWPVVFGAFASGETPFERSIRRRGVDLDRFHEALDRFIDQMSKRESFGYNDIETAELALDEIDVSGWSAGWGDLCLTIERRAPVCHAEPDAGASRFVHHDEWLPGEEWEPTAPEVASAELARRYLATYGPASEADLAHWAGIHTSTARGWLGQLGSDLAEIETGDETLQLLDVDRPSFDDSPGNVRRWAKMLGKYDPILLAHKDKSWLIDSADKNRVWRSGGRVEAVVLANGRIAGTWRYKRHPRALDLAVVLFEPPSSWLVDTITTEAERVANYFGLAPAEIAITTEETR